MKKTNTKSKFFKKIIALLMASFTILTNNQPSYAHNADNLISGEDITVRNSNSVTEQMENEAQAIARHFSGKSNIKINNEKDINEEMSVIEFECEGKDYGYIIFEEQDGSYIPTEFVIEEDVDYASYLLAFSSGIAYASNSSYMLSEMEPNTRLMNSCLLDNVKRFPKSRMINTTKRYACVVLALAEIAAQNDILMNNQEKDTFNQLWTDTKTVTDYVDNNITYGKTYGFNIESGMKKYVEREGHKLITSSELSPDFSFFSYAINKGYSCTLSYITNVGGDNFNHTVSVYGTFCRVSSDMKYYNYIGIADGWTGFAKFILYDDFRTSYCKGTSYNIY